MERFAECFSELPDPRADNALHDLTEILFIALMATLCDAFLALPGGFGTLDELFEALTWRQLGFHAKPCAVLNVDGYYDALQRFCDDARNAGDLGRHGIH